MMQSFTGFNQAANHLIGGGVPGRHGSGHPNIVPYQAFETSDRPLVVAAGNDKLFRLVCEAIGEPGLADDPRFVSNAVPCAPGTGGHRPGSGNTTGRFAPSWRPSHRRPTPGIHPDRRRSSCPAVAGRS